jgi:hypothetical protein
MKRVTMLSAVAIGVLVGLAALVFWWRSSDTVPQRRVYAAFSIVAPESVSESQLVARVLIDAVGGCPEIEAVGADGSFEIEMTPRLPGPNAAPVFSTVLACSASLPTGLESATVAGHVIPAAMPAQVRTIGMFADSGCRMDESRVQACNDPREWPLEQIVTNIVAAKPDLILDPGDYIYREIACPDQQLDRCGGTIGPVAGYPFSETDLGWVQEFFEPAQAMFSVAPIAFLRGNHEDCGRGGNGWFLYLDVFPDSMATCDPIVTDAGLKAPPPQTTPSWIFEVPVAIGRTLRVAMVDSAYGTDRELTPWIDQQRTMYQQAYDLSVPEPGVETWMQTHRPVFGMVSMRLMPESNPLVEPWTSDGQMVASYGLLDRYDLLISSHLHLAQVIQIPGQPASVVVGNGGALVEPTDRYEVPPFGPLANMDGSRIVSSLEPYPRPTLVWTRVEYGYAIATAGAGAGEWTIDQYDYDGSRSLACSLAERTISCPGAVDSNASAAVE